MLIRKCHSSLSQSLSPDEEHASEHTQSASLPHNVLQPPCLPAEWRGTSTVPPSANRGQIFPLQGAAVVAETFINVAKMPKKKGCDGRQGSPQDTQGNQPTTSNAKPGQAVPEQLPTKHRACGIQCPPPQSLPQVMLVVSQHHRHQWAAPQLQEPLVKFLGNKIEPRQRT